LGRITAVLAISRRELLVALAAGAAAADEKPSVAITIDDLG
jgi:hypothetical protein